MKNHKNIVVLYNKITWMSIDELDVLVQVNAVEKSLQHLGYSVHRVEFSKDLNLFMAKINEIKPDFVFNLVESFEENGKLLYIAASLLEFLKVDYTGGDSENLFITTNKILTKKYLKGYGLHTPHWLEENSGKDEFEKGKYIIKPVSEEASVDITVGSVIYFNNFEEVKNCLKRKKHETGKEFFAESYVTGREFNISLWGDKNVVSVFQPSEILFLENFKENNKILDYASKWHEDSNEYINTVRIFNFVPEDRKLLKKIEESAVKCWEEFKLNGYARIDYRVSEDGEPYILEINSNPCISPDSGFAAAIENCGINYIEMIQEIIKYRNKFRSVYESSKMEI